MDEYRMPHGIDNMEKFVFWDVDIVGVFVAIVGVGIFMNQFVTCFILAIISGKVISKLKYGKPDGYTFHLLYWLGGAKYKGLPESYIREFLE